MSPRLTLARELFYKIGTWLPVDVIELKLIAVCKYPEVRKTGWVIVRPKSKIITTDRSEYRPIFFLINTQYIFLGHLDSEDCTYWYTGSTIKINSVYLEFGLHEFDQYSHLFGVCGFDDCAQHGKINGRLS